METTQAPTLSSQQRRTLRCQSRSDARFFVARCRLDVAPGVDERVLGAALQGLVERHDILRAEFSGASGSAAEQTDAGALRIVHPGADEQSRPSGKALLANGGPLEAFLSSEGSARTLELRLPALAGDLHTLRNLVAELNASLAGGHVAKDSSPYALVAQWQQDLLHEPEAQVGIAFWKTKLANPPAVPRLLVEDHDPAGMFSPQRVSMAVEADVSASARALAQRLGVSLEAVYITAWKTLLARLTDSPELMMGVAHPGRTDEALEKVIGPLSRVLPLRLPFQRDIPLRSAIEETDRHLFDAKAWEECFADDAGSARVDAARLPLFVFEMPEPPTAPASAPLRIVDEYSCAHSFRLRLNVRASDIDVDFDGSCLRAIDAERIGTAYVDLLARMCASPERSGGAVEIIGAEERERLLREVCFGPAVAAPLLPVHERFVARARELPDRVAIATTDGAISYAQLEARSARIAADLVRRGIGPENSVGLFADGSPGMIAAVLGILRAGAAFVPLDRLAPPQRHQAIIAAAKPAALFAPTPAAQTALAELAAANSLPVLDGDATGVAAAPRVSVHPEHPAYILFTSGSTGEPKGIAIPHRALANHMAWIIDALGITQHDRLLQRTPLGFDASIWEVFAPLMTGACLVQCAPDANFDVEGLLDTLVRGEVTVTQTVPGLLQALMDVGLTQAKSLRVLCCGGDAVPARLWNEVAMLAHGEPVNLYGPTETCIDASWWRGTCAATKAVPIGRPIDGTDMFIVDGGSLAPAGVAGELHIGGAGLARGYIHQPQATAAVFVPHPWARVPGARAYRSGDFAFWDRDGVVNFIGRKDDQVKLRGVRVQLEEIRAAMLQHASVRECLVTLPPAEQGRQELLAFVELQAGRQSGDDAGDELMNDWKRHLRARLPDVMVPTHFVVLGAMPRTASGKLDRNALSGMRATPQRNAPRTPTERKIATIWMQLLNLREIDTEQNFFALGGHSLLLTKVVARVAEELNVQVPLRGLFDAPTLAGFAEMVDALKLQQDAAGATPRTESSHEPQTV